MSDFRAALGVVAAWKAGSWVDRSIMAFAVFAFSLPVFVVGYVLAYVFALAVRVVAGAGATRRWPRACAVAAEPSSCRPFALRQRSPSARDRTHLLGPSRCSKCCSRTISAPPAPRPGPAQHPVRSCAEKRSRSNRDRGSVSASPSLIGGAGGDRKACSRSRPLAGLTIDAILAASYYPVIRASLLLFSFLYVLVNLLVDVTYTLVDPRIRY